ncbi:hypothetical protein JHK85_006177 [Glycine max]|nr:hypothetical protein JHK85_006177 [Glycine max]
MRNHMPLHHQYQQACAGTVHVSFQRVVRSINSRDIKVFHCNWLTIQSDDHRGYDFISDYLETHRWPNIVRVKAYMTLYFEVKQILSAILQGLRNVEFLSLNYIRDEMDAASTPDLPLFKNLVQLRIFLKRDDSLLFELPSKCPKFERVSSSLKCQRRRLWKP